MNILTSLIVATVVSFAVSTAALADGPAVEYVANLNDGQMVEYIIIANGDGPAVEYAIITDAQGRVVKAIKQKG